MIWNDYSTTHSPYYTGYTVSSETISEELPVAIEDARAQLRMDDLRHDDEYLMLLIRAQCDIIERSYQCSLLNKTVTENHRQFPLSSITPMVIAGLWPIGSITSVQYYDSAGTLQTWASSEYTTNISSGCVTIMPKSNYTYPSDLAVRPDAVQITYVAGYGTSSASIPDSVRLGLLSRIGRAYTNREDSPEQVFSMSDVLLQSLRRWS